MRLQIASLLLCALPWLSHAQGERAGILIHAAGKVTVVREGKSLSGKSGAALLVGDVLQTAEKATAVVSLLEGTTLKMREASELTLSRLDRKGEEGPSQCEVDLGLGGLFAKVVSKVKGSLFRIKTPKAIAAVRGTQFFMAYGRQTRKGKDLWLCVNEGKVQVESLEDKKSVTVKEGEGVMVKAGRKITPPKSYDWTKELNWNMDPEKGNVVDTSDLDGAYSDLLDQDYE